LDIASTSPRKGDKGIVMEGMLAHWYAKNTGADRAVFEAEAERISRRLKIGARVLEIAPGPGYLAIALASLGPYEITGLDISRSFVRIAQTNALEAGVNVDFRRGDASAMAFADDAFDFILCQAAFKNFADPLGALGEMHRVLGRGGEAMIIDMRKDATNDAIDAEVTAMKLSRVDGWITGFIFRHTLRDRAYDEADFRRMAAASPFGACEVSQDPLALQVRLRKEDPRQAL
jgi:ubiquinone/menaquinone biosynthesis C-methylase UbiE